MTYMHLLFLLKSRMWNATYKTPHGNTVRLALQAQGLPFSNYTLFRLVFQSERLEVFFCPEIFPTFTSIFACVGQVVGQMRKRRQIELAATLLFSHFDPHCLESCEVRTKHKILTYNVEKPPKTAVFQNNWSEWGTRTTDCLLPKSKNHISSCVL